MFENFYITFLNFIGSHSLHLQCGALETSAVSEIYFIFAGHTLNS